ncbi:MAG: LysR family transcriptional regulator [Gemmatimonadetes bacterium]|nr:LysR family transcriptional regulator [Gemmatimonadota bacterium]
MELRHLRYFVVVAEEENIRRAAERLHIVQPALSRQMRQLEEELDCTLFDRLPRGIRLNAAGKEFLASARDILASADAAVAHVRRVAKGEVGRLRIGFRETASWFGIFPRAIQQYRARYPNVGLDLQPMFSTDQFEAIAEGTLDAGFCYTFASLPEGCEALPIRIDEVVLAVPRELNWKKRRNVRLVDLKSEAFVGLSRSHAPSYVDGIMATAYAGGLSPNIVQEAVDEPTLMSLVSAGIGIGFCNSANKGRKPQSVDFIRVVDFEFALTLCFAWNQSNSSTHLKALLSIVKQSANVDMV